MNRVSKALPWAVLDSIGTGLLSLLTLSLLARALSGADFGSVTLAQSIVVLIQLFTTFGMSEAIIQKRTLNALHHDSAFWACLGMGLLGYIVCLAIAGVLWMHEPNSVVPQILLIEGLACVFGGANLLPAALLDRVLQTKAVAKRMLAGKVSYCCAAIGLATAGAGIWSIVIAAFVQNVVNTVILWRGHSRIPHRRFSWPHVRQLAGFGFPIMVEGALWAFLNRVFNLMVGTIHGVDFLGHLNVAVRAVDSVSNLLLSVTGRIGLPLFSSLQDDSTRLMMAFSRGTEIITLISAPVFCGLMLTSADWVPLLLGEKWSQAAPLVNVVSLVWIVSFSRIFAAPYLRAIGKPNALLMPAACACAATIGAVLLTAHQPVTVVMLAWAARALVTFPLSVWLQRRFGGITLRQQLRPLFRPLLCSVTMAGVIVFWKAVNTTITDHAAILGLTVLIGATVYLFAVTASYWRKLKPYVLRRRVC